MWGRRESEHMTQMVEIDTGRIHTDQNRKMKKEKREKKDRVSVWLSMEKESIGEKLKVLRKKQNDEGKKIPAEAL